MLFKLPIMLLSNAPKSSLLFPNYAPLWTLCSIKLGRLTALLEYMTVLLEYLDLSISVAGHSKDLVGPAPPLATPLKTRHGVRRLH